MKKKLIPRADVLAMFEGAIKGWEMLRRDPGGPVHRARCAEHIQHLKQLKKAISCIPECEP